MLAVVSFYVVLVLRLFFLIRTNQKEGKLLVVNEFLFIPVTVMVAVLVIVVAVVVVVVIVAEVQLY